MAKHTKHSTPPEDLAPGADPNAKNSLLSRRVGNVLNICCLLIFFVFEELWIGTLAFALGFAIIFCMEAFYERSKVWYTSLNLYCIPLCLLLTYLEYYYGFVSRLVPNS